jgi:hypothetical protein
VTEDLYVRRLLAAYRDLPDASHRVRPADRRLAVQLYRQQVPLELLTAAFHLALARRHARPLDATPLNTIRSLHYFLPVLDEARTLDPDYLDYVVRRAEIDSTPQQPGGNQR